MSTFDKLIEQRKKMGITQREMAKNLRITPSTINKYEKGTRKISSEMQDVYAKFLGIEIFLMIKQ